MASLLNGEDIGFDPGVLLYLDDYLLHAAKQQKSQGESRNGDSNTGIADPFDFVAGKLASVGRRGGFPTPRAIAMLKPGGMSALVVPERMVPGRSGGEHKLRRMSMHRFCRAVGSDGRLAGTVRRPWWRLVKGRWPGAHLHGGSDKLAAAEARCERYVGAR